MAGAARSALFVLAALAATGLSARADSGVISDAEALAIAHKHCTACHARKPAHESIQEAPKDVILETVADLRRYAAAIYETTVQNRSMPLGTQMTEQERGALARWIRAQP